MFVVQQTHKFSIVISGCKMDCCGSVRTQCSLSDLADLNKGSISIFKPTARSLESTTKWSTLVTELSAQTLGVDHVFRSSGFMGNSES